MKGYTHLVTGLCLAFSFGNADSPESLLEGKTAVESRQLPGNEISPYAPTSVKCPSVSLLRTGKSLAPAERQAAAKRKVKATKALKKFLKSSGDFPTLDNYPMLALANSGGGVRAFLIGAGMRIAFDDREGSKYTTSGLLQAMTYESGLSSSAVSLGSVVGNNNQKASHLYDTIWKQAFANGLQKPDGAQGEGPAYAGIVKDVLAKLATGAPTTANDVSSRLFGYVAFKTDKNGPAGVGKIFSKAYEESPAYKNHEAPIPIITALNLEDAGKGCGLAPINSTQFEFTPFEFGSFDKDVRAFTPSKYMGSTLNNGKPDNGLNGVLKTPCFTGFDNLNFVIGSSTAIRNQYCGFFGGYQNSSALGRLGIKAVEEIFNPILGNGQIPFFAIVPNYGYKVAKAPKIKKQRHLNLVDGGENTQVVPIWPYLFRRDVKVMFMTDSGTAGRGSGRINYPNGRALYVAWQQAVKQGYGSRLPKIPNLDIFAKKQLTKKNVFFGCNLAPSDPAMTIIYMPNRKITYPTDIRTDTVRFKPEVSKAVIENGAQVGSNGNESQYGFCVSCVIMKRQAEAEGKKLPKGCAKCFKKYCYN